ncbi:MAG: LVIVD repeat-containing protein [Oligoflexales bacterium]
MRILALALMTVTSFTWTAKSMASEKLALLSQMNKYAGYNDVWGYTDPNGREYALLGVVNGTSVVDITDAPNIREVAFIESANSIWKDIKTYKNYAYVVNESGGGLQVLDLSDLPNSVKLVNTYTEIRTSHNIWVDEEAGLIYLEGNMIKPVIVLSLADPIHPVEISKFGVECHDIYVRDHIAYIAEGYSGTFALFDMKDPAAPTLLKRFRIPNAGYVHNLWLTEDGSHLMSTEETTGKTVKMWDISDLNNIHMTGEYLGPQKIMAHNTHIKGNYAYISHYADGLRVVDISDPTNITEVANYWEPANAPNAWGAYPFFKSGKVLISGIETGLYVVQFDLGRE